MVVLVWPQKETQERLREAKFTKVTGSRDIVTACHEEATWRECPGSELSK